jgi:hypothetical protein
MDKTDKYHKLTREITSYFEDGILMDGQVKAYVDTCFPEIIGFKVGTDNGSDQIRWVPDLEVNLIAKFK